MARSPTPPVRLKLRSKNAIVVALFWKFSAFLFSLASAASFDFASADSSCATAEEGSGARRSVMAANANAMCRVVFIETSTVLRARRDDASAEQRNGADQAGTRLDPRATHLDSQSLPETALEIGLPDV